MGRQYNCETMASAKCETWMRMDRLTMEGYDHDSGRGEGFGAARPVVVNSFVEKLGVGTWRLDCGVAVKARETRSNRKLFSPFLI